jgi:adenosylcobinamide-phosphate synthase
VLVSRVWGFSWRQAWIIWQRDGRLYPSPNAGLPQAALAGALQIRLGGPAVYGGVRSEKPFLGDDRAEITRVEYRRTVIILYASSVVMALVVLGGRFLWEYLVRCV